MSEVERLADRAIVKPGMDLVASMVQEFKKEMKSILEDNPEQIVINLDGVEMIDSVGIGVLIATHNTLSKLGGKLTIINASANIYGLFKTMRLDKHFAVSESS